MLARATLVLILLSLTATDSTACSCRGFGPACTEVVSPEISAVFLGTVVSISPHLPHSFDAEELSSSLLGETVDVKLSVQESYKGVSTDQVLVNTMRSESACGFPFKKGEQYVVYASEYKGRLHTSICHRTLPRKLAEDDLTYLRALKSLPPTGRVSGSYKRYTFDTKFVAKFTPSLMDHYRPPEEEYRAMAPMAGEQVTLIAPDGGKRETKIDSEGRFLFEDLAPGKYSIKVTVPPRLAPPLGYAAGLRFGLDALEILPKGCAEVTFRTQPDGRINGRVLDQDGKPLRNVEVIVWNAAEEFRFYGGAGREYGKEDGSFEMGPLPPGEYILGAYVWVLPQGFPAMADERDRLTQATLRYFPNVISPNLATRIKIGFGEHIRNIEIRIPYDPAAWKSVKGSS